MSCARLPEAAPAPDVPACRTCTRPSGPREPRLATLAFDQTHIVDPRIRERLNAERGDEAFDLATRQIAEGLSDLAVVEAACGRLEPALDKLQDAVKACPDSQTAFHNLIATLLQHRLFKSDNFDAISRHMTHYWDTCEWLSQYRRLINMPTFLNLEFVRGKCNLRCRMCTGIHAEDHPKQLSYVSVDEFRTILAAAPTITGVTLSSGDSDPLLHPGFDRIVEAARDADVLLDLYTNGHALSARTCRKIVETQAVSMINFSIDAATPETYRKIRGADLGRLIRKIEMLGAMKAEGGGARPMIEVSLTAMADTIQELPGFVRLGARLGAERVFVGDLIGWLDDDGPNRVATEHPQCFEFVAEAQRLASEADVDLVLPERLLADAHAPGDAPPAGSRRLTVCGWISGVWVCQDGRLDPCCTVHGVADMGNIHDGPILENDKYARVKDLLRSGKVFERCLEQRGCEYIQQRRAEGTTPDVISREELGDLHPDAMASTPERAAAAP